MPTGASFARTWVGFDNWGNPLKWTDPQGTQRGYHFRAEYDLAGRPLRIQKILGTPTSPSTTTVTWHGTNPGFETGDLTGWEKGYLSGNNFTLDAAGGYWKVTNYGAVSGCPIPPPPGATASNKGLYFGSSASCTYGSGAPSNQQAVRILATGVHRDAVLTFKYWRHVREGDLPNKDRFRVYAVLEHGTDLTNRRLVLDLGPLQRSLAKWQRWPDVRLSDYFEPSEWPEGTSTRNLQVLFVFEKGDTSTQNLGRGLMIDDVSIVRRGVETLVEFGYDVPHCDGPEILQDACLEGAGSTDFAKGELTTVTGYQSGEKIDERRLVYRGLSGRLSGEEHRINWAGVARPEVATDWARWTTLYHYDSHGMLDKILAPYLPDDPGRRYTYSYRRGLLDELREQTTQMGFLTRQQAGGDAITYGRAGGPSRLVFGNGTTLDIAYDECVRSRIASMTARVRQSGTNDLLTAWQTGTFGFDPAGNLVSMIVGDTQQQSFGYDESGRLTHAAMLPLAHNPNATTPEVMKYSYNVFGNLTASNRVGGSAQSQSVLECEHTYPSGDANQNRIAATTWPGINYRYDLNGRMTRSGGVGVAQPTQIGITWADSNLLAGYHYMDAAGKLGAPVDRYLYDAAGLRVVEWPVGRDGVPRITLRSPSGQPLAEFAAQPGSARPALVKDVVHGPFGVVVEREVTATAPTVLNGAPMTDGAGGYNVDVSTGSGSYELDIDSISGWHNRRSGLVADANGRLIVAEIDLSPGETNVLRIRKESPSTDFSAPMSVTYDPSVTASSANQVRSVSVSRSTGTITVRWAVLSDNGKNFRVRYRLSDGSGSVLLTPTALPSSARSLTLTSQALATGCGTIYIGQVSPGLENETVDGPEAGVPSGFPGGMDRADCPPGGGVSDPPQPPSPTYAFREWFQVRDHLGSVRVISDETGEARERLDYYPYGTEMNFGSLASTSDRKYTGHERDDALGADYMMARSKFTWSGSFLSPDPIDDVSLDMPWSWNRYAYVRGNPVLLLDPTGLASLNIFECTKIGGWWVDGKCVLPAVEVTVRPKFRLRGFRIPLRGGFGFGRGAPGLPGPPTPPGPDDARPPCVEIEPETEWWRYMGSVENTLEGPVGAFVVGFGDGASMGIVPFLRSAENWQRVDTGGWYLAGNVTGEAWMAVASAGATAERNVFIHHLPGGPYKGFLGQPKSTEWIRKFLLRWGKADGQTWHMNLVGKWHVPAQCH